MAADDPQAVAAAGAPLADGGGLPEDRVHLEECLVDGLITFAAENASGRFFLFTQVEEDGPPRPGRKTPAETGRQGLYEAIGRTYQAVFPEGNANKAGQLYGKVVQEGHSRSNVASMRRLHNHAACAFPTEHRWKTVERHLREVEGVKVCAACARPCLRERLLCNLAASKDLNDRQVAATRMHCRLQSVVNAYSVMAEL